MTRAEAFPALIEDAQKIGAALVVILLALWPPTQR